MIIIRIGQITLIDSCRFLCSYLTDCLKISQSGTKLLPPDKVTEKRETHCHPLEPTFHQCGLLAQSVSAGQLLKHHKENINFPSITFIPLNGNTCIQRITNRRDAEFLLWFEWLPIQMTKIILLRVLTQTINKLGRLCPKFPFLCGSSSS